MARRLAMALYFKRCWVSMNSDPGLIIHWNFITFFLQFLVPADEDKVGAIVRVFFSPKTAFIL